MGYKNAVSLTRLKDEVKSGGYDAVIHVGGKTGGEWALVLCLLQS